MVAVECWADRCRMDMGGVCGGLWVQPAAPGDVDVVGGWGHHVSAPSARNAFTFRPLTCAKSGPRAVAICSGSQSGCSSAMAGACQANSVAGIVRCDNEGGFLPRFLPLSLSPPNDRQKRQKVQKPRAPTGNDLNLSGPQARGRFLPFLPFLPMVRWPPCVRARGDAAETGQNS